LLSYINSNQCPLNFALAYFLRECSSMAEVFERSEIALQSFGILQVLSEQSRNVMEFLHGNSDKGFANLLGLTESLRGQLLVFNKVATDMDSDQKKICDNLSPLLDSIIHSSSSADEEKYAEMKQLENPNMESKEASTDEVRKWLKAQQFKFADLSKEPFIFQSEVDASTKMSKAKLQRLRKELASLADSLPDGIYVRVNEDRFDIMKFMIVGPGTTPYENGCFVFDMFLPDAYPSVPPHCKLVTTGHGQVRFNPNLYNDGKVCLSLLGTWSGPGWDPQVSTILQVLVSIQAMVFVDYPYTNEPSYESQGQSDQSLAYNKGLRQATMKFAMSEWLEDLDSNPRHFVEVARAHFWLQRAYLLEQMDRWSDLNKKVSSACYYWDCNLVLNQDAVKECEKKFKDQLNALSPPNTTVV